jgi:hypothetical protein
MYIGQHPPDRGVFRCPSPFGRARSIALISRTFFAYDTHAEKLRITSTPRGAKVEINGVAVGTTPFEKDYPGGYFRKTKTAVGSRGGHPLVARLSFDGYSIKEIHGVLAASVRRPKVIFQRINVFCIDAASYATQNTRPRSTRMVATRSLASRST